MSNYFSFCNRNLAAWFCSHWLVMTRTEKAFTWKKLVTKNVSKGDSTVKWNIIDNPRIMRSFVCLFPKPKNKSVDSCPSYRFKCMAIDKYFKYLLDRENHGLFLLVKFAVRRGRLYGSICITLFVKLEELCKGIFFVYTLKPNALSLVAIYYRQIVLWHVTSTSQTLLRHYQGKQLDTMLTPSISG